LTQTAATGNSTSLLQRILIVTRAAGTLTVPKKNSNSCFRLAFLLTLTAAANSAAIAWGQPPQVQLPATPPGAPALAPITPIQPGGVPVQPGVQYQPNGVVAQPGTYIQQPFDAFGTSGANSPPTLLQPSQPQFVTPGQQPFLQSPQFTPQQYGQTPINPGSQAGWGPGYMLSNPESGPYLRLFQDIRLDYTWIAGEATDTDVGIHDIEVGTTVNFPNFLWTQQPLHISPGFILHLWDGPTGAADLPSNAYSAFATFDYTTNPQLRAGAEANVTVGVFSDFNTVTTDSVRAFGTGLGFFRVTPTVTLKGGVTYLDRLDLKLLPAFGLFWRPNEDVYFEIFFPKPKLSQRITTWGNTDVWLYVGGEYGGSSWTVERTAGNSERADLNDIRVYGGFEFVSRVSAWRGYIEAGGVFERELFYENSVQDNRDLDSTFMLRAGVAY